MNQAFGAVRLPRTSSVWLLFGVLTSTSILSAEDRPPRNPQEELRESVHDNAVASREAAARTDRILSYITVGAVAALVVHRLDHYRGRMPVFLVPMDKEHLVRQMYDLGARNCEMHFCQVRGVFKPFRGVNMPTFLPETG